MGPQPQKIGHICYKGWDMHQKGMGKRFLLASHGLRIASGGTSEREDNAAQLL